MKQTTKWQDELQSANLSLTDLAALLNLPSEALLGAEKATSLFALRVPRGYLKRIRKNDLNDPLLQELLPTAQEALTVPGYKTDALDEKRFNPLPGLLHKYQGRVLITLTGHCAVNCRYCFRRAFSYEENQITPQDWEAILQYIRQDKSLREVILSGGDPLSAPDHFLKKRYEALAEITHLTTVRFHTRFPVLIPSRVTDELLNIIQQSRLKTVFVFHINHPNALQDDLLKEKLKALKTAGVLLLNQSVLLKGINNSVATLYDLSMALFEEGIMPYYLHQMDKVAGAAHFDVPEAEARAIMQSLAEKLPGYLVPKWVQERPGEPSKSAMTY